MPKKKSSKRVEKLFSEIEQLASEVSGDGLQELPVPVAPINESTQPEIPAASMLQELKSLRERVKELETQIDEKNGKAPSAPILYEKEEVGFAYVGDKVMPVKANQKPVQDEADVVKTPLTSSGRSIGEVQIAKPSERP